MANHLPAKLGKEPLIDAIFELRFSGSTPASVVLPGLLFSNLSGEKKIESLPASQLPKAIREGDPNLRFAPLSRLDWEGYFVNIGDQNISVSSKYPYQGWGNFKSAIIKVMDVLSASSIINGVERYSMKYVDLLTATDDRQKVSLINFDVSIANHKLTEEPFQLRIEIPRDGFINAVQVVSSAHAVLHNGKVMDGLVVDIDSFCKQDGISIQKVMEDFEEKLDAIHSTNKSIFFDCLRPETIESLDPKYE
ncbi:TIGR04255 family protein [Thiobacillus sp.]